MNQFPFKCPAVKCKGVLVYADNSGLKCENYPDKCTFAISHSRIGKDKSFFNMRLKDGAINTSLLQKILDGIPERRQRNRPLAREKSIMKDPARSKMQIIASRYGLELEDIYSIKHSTESLQGLASYYGLTLKDIRRIKSADIKN